MKNLALGLAFMLTATLHRSAQVTLAVTSEQEQFLPGESIEVAARITNLSGQTLRLGDTEGWLTFAIESDNGLVVTKTGEVPVASTFTLENSKRAIVRADLAPY